MSTDKPKTEKTSRRSGLPLPATKPKSSRSRVGSNEKDPPRPLVKQSSKKELQDQNARLTEEIQQKKEKIREIETILRNKDEAYEFLKKEAEEKENLHQANLEKSLTKCENTESKLTELQNRVMMSNIDPVTLKVLTIEDEDNNYQKQAKAKEEASTLRDTLSYVNTLVSEQLDFMKNADIELEAILDSGGSS